MLQEDPKSALPSLELDDSELVAEVSQENLETTTQPSEGQPTNNLTYESEIMDGGRISTAKLGNPNLNHSEADLPKNLMRVDFAKRDFNQPVSSIEDFRRAARMDGMPEDSPASPNAELHSTAREQGSANSQQKASQETAPTLEERFLNPNLHSSEQSSFEHKIPDNVISSEKKVASADEAVSQDARVLQGHDLAHPGETDDQHTRHVVASLPEQDQTHGHLESASSQPVESDGPISNDPESAAYGNDIYELLKKSRGRHLESLQQAA